MVLDNPKALGDGGEIPKSQGCWHFRFMAVKSSIYLTKTCQEVNCLLCFDVGMSVFCLKKEKDK